MIGFPRSSLPLVSTRLEVQNGTAWGACARDADARRGDESGSGRSSSSIRVLPTRGPTTRGPSSSRRMTADSRPRSRVRSDPRAQLKDGRSSRSHRSSARRPQRHLVPLDPVGLVASATSYTADDEVSMVDTATGSRRSATASEGASVGIIVCPITPARRAQTISASASPQTWSVRPRTLAEADDQRPRH